MTGLQAKLILIKHSMPEVDPATPPPTWQLGTIGRERCLPLAKMLTPYLPIVLFSSREPKATATAVELARMWGITWTPHTGLEEHHRHTAPFLGNSEFRTTIQRLFQYPAALMFGEETADAAYQRFATALQYILDEHPRQIVAVVTHGTVMALWASRQLAGVDGFTLWEQLGLPSALVIDREAMQLEQICVPYGIA
jgi:broad specificity phosphatase PhoE